MTKIFRNYMTGEFEAECTEYRQMSQSPHKAWFIKIGFAGFNSVANNWNGYVSKASAEAACLRYQYKGERTSLDRGRLEAVTKIRTKDLPQAVTKIRTKDLPHHSNGYIDGLKAFDAGKKAIPALDENTKLYIRAKGLGEMTSDNLKAYNAYLRGWIKGWHVAKCQES